MKHFVFASHVCAFLGNDPADEDVDIGGNEPPVSSYPPVEIEKDTGYKISKGISSSSSSGKLSLFCCGLSLVRSLICFVS